MKALVSSLHEPNIKVTFSDCPGEVYHVPGVREYQLTVTGEITDAERDALIEAFKHVAEVELSLGHDRPT